MNPESAAVAVLVLYAVSAAGLVWHDARCCPDGVRVWFLHMVTRLFTPLVFRQRLSHCRLPVEGGGIVIANHRSPVDPMVIFSATSQKEDGYCIRRVEFLTAREYCEIGGVMGFITRNMGVIPVERNGRDMRPVREALRRAKSGRLVGVFPEGRINKGEGLLPAIPGVAWLALHAQVPVYPVFIRNAPQGRNMIEPFMTFCRIHVNIGDSIDLSCYEGRKIDQDLLREVTDLLMRKLAETGGLAGPNEEPHTLRAFGDRVQAG